MPVGRVRSLSGERVSAFTLPDTLPVVADVEALPGVCALLTLADGSQLPVGPSDLPSLTPTEPEGLDLLIRWDREPTDAIMYRVPASLSGRAAWAVGCRPHFTPTLTGIDLTPDAVTFTAMQNGGGVCTLTVPRGASVHLSRPLPRFAGMPAKLTITDQQGGRASEPDAGPTRVFFFEVYPETLEGAACLEALGMTVSSPDTEA